MKIDGLINSFNNIDSELIETNNKKSEESPSPIGLEVKQLPNTESAKGKFKDVPTSGKSDRPINLTDSNFLKSQIQNSLNQSGNDRANNNRFFPSLINRPNANNLSLGNNRSNKKSGSFNIPNNASTNTSKELSTKINLPIEQTAKLGNLFNQKDNIKQTLNAENKPDKTPNNPNPKGGKPLDQTQGHTTSQIKDLENAIEIGIFQSIEVSSDPKGDFSIQSDVIVKEEGSLDNGGSRTGRGPKDTAFNILLPSDNTSLGETAVENTIPLLANNGLAQTLPLPQFAANQEIESLALDGNLSLSDQSNFASTVKLDYSNLFAGQLNLINSALEDINSLANPSLLDKTSLDRTSLDKTSLLGQPSPTNSTNKIDISELTTSKTLSVAVGQSLEQVANELGVGVFDLLKANPQLLKDPLLFAGKQVNIPNAQELGNPSANNLTLAANQSLENQLSNLPSQIPLEQTKANLEGISGVISQTSNQTESAKILTSNIELNANVILDKLDKMDKSDKNLQATQQKRNIEPNNGRPEIKHTEPSIPGFGVFVNREMEFEIDDDRPQSRKKLNLPEPFDEWADHIYSAADKYRLDASLIASVIWCESAGKNLIGKNGHGHGLMQIDDQHYKQWLDANESGLNPATNIDFGVSILRKNIDYFRGKSAAGIAAYDCGVDLVEEALVVGKDIDFFTTDKNYSFRILAQQDYFRRFFD